MKKGSEQTNIINYLNLCTLIIYEEFCMKLNWSTLGADRLQQFQVYVLKKNNLETPFSAIIDEKIFNQC